MTPLDTTVKVGPEVFLFLSSASQTLLSIDLALIPQATELGTASQMAWEEAGFIRNPVTWSEPKELTDIYKHFNIDHTKPGREQRKNLSFVVAFQNTNVMLRKYRDKESLVKLEWHIEGAGAINEFEYFTSVRFLNLTRENPDGEAVQRVDAIFAKYGRRDG